MSLDWLHVGDRVQLVKYGVTFARGIDPYSFGTVIVVTEVSGNEYIRVAVDGGTQTGWISARDVERIEEVEE